jgi:hypothetical protein
MAVAASKLHIGDFVTEGDLVYEVALIRSDQVGRALCKSIDIATGSQTGDVNIYTDRVSYATKDVIRRVLNGRLAELTAQVTSLQNTIKLLTRKLSLIDSDMDAEAECIAQIKAVMKLNRNATDKMQLVSEAIGKNIQVRF